MCNIINYSLHLCVSIRRGDHKLQEKTVIRAMKAVLESILVKVLEDIRDCSKMPTHIFCYFFFFKEKTLPIKQCMSLIPCEAT